VYRTLFDYLPWRFIYVHFAQGQLYFAWLNKNVHANENANANAVPVCSHILKYVPMCFAFTCRFHASKCWQTGVIRRPPIVKQKFVIMKTSYWYWWLWQLDLRG